MNPTYPRFVVLKTINIIGTAAFCPSWAKIRLTQVRLIRGLLYFILDIVRMKSLKVNKDETDEILG